MNVAFELKLLKEIAGDLPDYLLSDVLYWQMAGSGDFPKLSLGIALLTRARLTAVQDQLNDQQRADLQAALTKIDATLEKWRSTAEKKAVQELRSRATLWQRYWDECRQDPQSCASSYPHEVTNRVIAQLLLRAFPTLAKSPDALTLTPIDRAVRTRLQGDQFVWPSELQPALPKSDYPFLYGTL
ncbi:MAG: hypothetical protein ABI847_07095 [Anaerolineales bacterium]